MEAPRDTGVLLCPNCGELGDDEIVWMSDCLDGRLVWYGYCLHCESELS